MRSRAGRNGKEPCSFCLGRCELHVADILERRELTGVHRFRGPAARLAWHALMRRSR